MKRTLAFMLFIGVLRGSQAPTVGVAAQADGRPAAEAAIDGPSNVALDRAGNLYLTSPNENRVYKVGSDGILRLLAGSGIPGYSGDGGLATAARLEAPWGIAVDSKGNVYVADQINRRIRRITPVGLISTVSGNGEFGYNGDGGPALDAQIGVPNSLAIDSHDNLYISADGRIRKVSADGLITTLSQNLGHESIAVDTEGNLYIVGTNRIYKLSPRGVVSVIAGNGQGGATSSGLATGGPLGGPTAVAVDSAGNIYIATGYDRVWKVSNGRISTFAGGGRAGRLGDRGPATSARLKNPVGMATDAKGNVYIADSGNHRVRKVGASGVIDTVAGNGLSGYRGDGGPAAQALLVAGALKVAVDGADNLYVADTCRVRKVTRLGVITTVAGTGVCGYGGDGGLATAAQLSGSGLGLGTDHAGNLYIADTGNHRIRRVTPSGIISTVAGNGTEGEKGDGGPATSAQLRSPRGVATDATGNLYIADGSVRRVAPNGVISTLIAGAGGYGGVVTEALRGPESVAVDSMGNVVVADTNNFRIRKLTPSGVLSTIAGTGIVGFSGDGGPATSAQLHTPGGVAVDGAGNVYIADTLNRRVRRVSVNGTISTIAGTGLNAFGGDGGPATSAQLFAVSIARDSAGNLYVGDQGNRRVRKITPDGVISTFAGVGPPAK